MNNLSRSAADFQPAGSGGTGLARPRLAPTQPVERKQRHRTWELSASCHCSIIGTCLSTGELRQVLTKAGDAAAHKASDHVLHASGVRAAGRHDIAGKLLNKALDRRHETIIKRFTRANSVEDLRKLWRDAFDNGEISGAYWAVLSHPLQDHDLIREVFGEVHMLSHLIGSASRLDVARLAKLEAAVQQRDEIIARQQFRLDEAARARASLKQEISSLKERVCLREVQPTSPQKPLPVSRKHDEDVLHRMESLQAELQAAREKIREMEAVRLEDAAHIEALNCEVATLDTLSHWQARPDNKTYEARTGEKVLYVGGRRHHYDQIRTLADRFGVELLFHDGGLEDNTSLLPGLIGQADRIVFPVDHISHTAAGMTKKHCQILQKTFIPLRSAGLGSFAAAIFASTPVRDFEN